MVLKDSLVRWFIRNIVLPRQEIIDQPGFIISQWSEKGIQVYLRDLFFPEKIYIDLEKELAKNSKEIGLHALYSAGKKFGIEYCKASNFSHIHNSSEKDIKKLMYLFVRYIECTWAHRIKYSINIKSQKAEFIYDQPVVCRKSGFGDLLSKGVTTGFWSYIMDNYKIEGAQLKCQGRGDDKCLVVVGPPEELKKDNIKFFTENNLNNLELDKNHKKINTIRPTSYAKMSFKNLLDGKFFTYSKGFVERKKRRHFLIDSSLVDLVELELNKVDGGKEVLFETAFNYGKELAVEEDKADFNKYITDYMSALGWGDVLVTKAKGKYSVITKYFPWSKFSNSISFATYRGVLSGLISGFLERNIIFEKAQTTLDGGYLTVILSE